MVALKHEMTWSERIRAASCSARGAELPLSPDYASSFPAPHARPEAAQVVTHAVDRTCRERTAIHVERTANTISGKHITIQMALQQWALPQLSELLPLDEGELKQIISYTDTLPDTEAAKHLGDLLGDSPSADHFITSFIERRSETSTGMSKHAPDTKDAQFAPPSHPPPSHGQHANGGIDAKQTPDIMLSDGAGADSITDPKGLRQDVNGEPPAYAPPAGPPPAVTSTRPPPAATSSRTPTHKHTNAVIKAAELRAIDEVCQHEPCCDHIEQHQLTHSQQEMQQMLQNLQFEYGIYNSDIEPEHETEYPCSCSIHRYQARKWRRYGVQDQWSRAVMYPGTSPYLIQIVHFIQLISGSRRESIHRQRRPRHDAFQQQSIPFPGRVTLRLLCWQYPRHDVGPAKACSGLSCAVYPPDHHVEQCPQPRGSSQH